jgi:hypothetical protein
MLIEERVTNVEAALARFMEQSAAILAAIHEDIAEIRASNARTDRQLLTMQQQAERDRQQIERNRQQAEHDRDLDRKDFNKRMAEISDSMGRLIEDMVAPCGFNLAKAIFSNEEALSCAVRIRRRHPTVPGRSLEYDLMAVGPTKVLVVEAKWTVAPGKAREFQEQMEQFAEFFPEHAGKTLYPAFASVHLEPSIVAFLNREKIHGIAMGDEVMEVVNLGQF